MKELKKFATKGILAVILLLAVFSVGTVIAGQFARQENHISRMELLRDYSIESESDEDELPHSGTFTYEISSGCTDDSNLNDCFVTGVTLNRNDQPEQGDVFRLLPLETIDYMDGPTGGNFTINLDQPKENGNFLPVIVNDDLHNWLPCFQPPKKEEWKWVDLGTANGDGQFPAPATVQVSADSSDDTLVSSIDLFPDKALPKGTYQLYATLDGENNTWTTNTVTFYVADAEETGPWGRFKSWAQDSFADQPPDEVWSNSAVVWLPCRTPNEPWKTVECILQRDGNSYYYYHPNLKTKFKCLIHDLF